MSGLLNIENARIGFRNFEGREGMYNKEGDRNFVVFLDFKTADKLSEEGWNIKYPREDSKIIPEEDTREPFLPVSISTNKYPSVVYMKSNGNVVRLGEGELDILDWSELEHVDLVIRPYTWNVNNNEGIKAYLKTGYFTIITDKFAEKYGL